MSNPPAPYTPAPALPHAQESSTALRAISILASRNPEGDFKVDDSRLIIKYSPQYISEGSSQEDKHDRYTNMTFFILSCIAPRVRERRRDPQDEMVLEYDDLRSDLSKCHIVAVGSEPKTIGGRIEYTEFKTSIGRGDGKDGMNAIPSADVLTPISGFAEGLKEARENGFRRINCTARMNYFRALQLAYLIGYIDPDEGMDISVNKPRAEKMLSEEEKLRQMRKG